MSKKKKAKHKGSSKADKVKKSLKKVNKPVAKKDKAKKSASSAAKKNDKKSSKKPAPVKKKLIKPTPKKTQKPVKTKVAAKAPKKAKPVKKTPAKPVKKVVAKALVKKAPPVRKPVIAKKEAKPVKPVKPIAHQTPKKGEKVVVERTVNKPVNKPQPKPLVAEKPKKAEEVLSKKSAAAEKKPHDVLAITNTIPVKEKPFISASRIASISHSITNPIKRPDSYSVRVEKEPPGKFEMEFVVHASAEMLYEFLSTPSGLSEWFCDDLNIRNGIYTFIWEDTMQQARLLKTVELQLVRFQWVDKTDGSYFEFRIQRDDLTNDISLIITDFADSPGDRESSRLLWHSQIEKLMHVIGSIF